jgi:DNA-binding GntR family transcriptional regulator
MPKGAIVESLRRVSTVPGSEPAFGKPRTETYTLAEQIAERMADSIVAGRYSPGTWISEQEVADVFGVSRGPIREALRILEKEGFVQILPRRGTKVTALSRREVKDIFTIRATLMALAARLTAEDLTSDVETELKSCASKLEQLAQGNDDYEFLRVAYRASMFLAESSRNSRLHALFLSMARQTLPLTRMALATKANRKMWAKNFRGIVKGVLASDANAAAEAANQLVAQTGIQAAQYAAVADGDRRENRRNGRRSRHVGS